MQTLRDNTTLQGGKYRILRVLGQGGFGITYLAEQTILGRQVAIKEFFVKEFCCRDVSTSHVTFGAEGSRETVIRLREKFLKEARNIAKLNHPNIVKRFDVFEENGTAYYVMEYVEGISLAEKLKSEGFFMADMSISGRLYIGWRNTKVYAVVICANFTMPPNMRNMQNVG